MEKIIYLIRHGETDYNKQGIVQGRGVNTDLNETGRAQATSFYKKYKDVPFDKIYTSTLKRTHQTVARFIEKDIPWLQFAGLDEMAWGIYEGRFMDEEIKGAHEEIMKIWTNGVLDHKFENGESPLDVKERQLKVFEHLIEESETDKNILICMHGRAMRLFLCLLMNKPLSEMETFPHSNTTLYKLRYDGSAFEILEFNNTDHLKEHCE